MPGQRPAQILDMHARPAIDVGRILVGEQRHLLHVSHRRPPLNRSRRHRHDLAPAAPGNLPHHRSARPATDTRASQKPCRHLPALAHFPRGYGQQSQLPRPFLLSALAGCRAPADRSRQALAVWTFDFVCTKWHRTVCGNRLGRGKPGQLSRARRLPCRERQAGVRRFHLSRERRPHGRPAGQRPLHAWQGGRAL